MATNSAQLQETILKAIDAVVTQRNNDLKLDKTIIGIVKKNIGKRGTKPLYQIEYSGGIIEAVAQNVTDVYSPHTSVYVLIPQGNFSNEKIIIGRSSSIITDRSASVVAAAINNYSIVGANLLTSLTEENIKDRKFGLYSFHPSFRDTVEIDGISHRALFLYQKDNENNTITFNDNRLNVYKEEATAIMVKADFLTNLDSIQKEQPNARYGLIFNFTFDNLNKGYGETNGEILKTVSEIVRGTVLDDEGYESEKTLKNIIDTFEAYFNNTEINLDDWIEDNTGLIDRTIENIQALYNSFKVEEAKLDKEIINNTIQAYLTLLNELKYKENIPDIALRYTEWSEEVVGDNAQKNIQFVLSSDDMIGNPFNFNTWNTQYSVFNINLETFNHLDSILFYKEGFYVDTPETNYEHQWPIGTNGEPDIFVKNLQIYAMNPLDSQSGDYTLNVEPYLDSDIFVSAENSSTRFKATLLRRSYEDLTANGKTSFYWFKEDSSVINSESKKYNYLGGAGWRKLEHNETNYLFTTTVEENTAYKNNYKCVAVYEPSADDKTILSFTFSVYNEDENIDVKLESNLGTNFSFDAGTPTIKILINENRTTSEEYLEFGADSDYLYSWTIDDAANGYTLFLDEVADVLRDELTASEAILLSAKRSLLKKIKFFTLEEQTNSPSQATRIKYPVSISSSGFTVKCYVKKKKENGLYYDVGSASLSFENKNESVAAGYRIHIVNGDQVFQYDEYGNTPCSEKKKNPLVIKPLQAKLFTPSGIEVEGTNYQVEWIFPIESTMIHTDETLRINPATDLVQSYVGNEINFYINDLYDPDAYANQITCHVHFGDIDYYKDTNFYFGKQGNNGTNGTDTVAKIIYNKNDFSNILHYQPLTLYVQKENTDTGIDGKGFLNVGTRNLTDTIQFINPDNPENNILRLEVYQKENILDSSNYNTGFPKWNLAGNANERTNDTGKFFEITFTNIQNGTGLVWKYSYPENNSTNKTYYRLQNIKASVQLKTGQMYYAFFSLPIIEYEPAELSAHVLLPINRISIDKEYYLNEIIYNADGRNPVYNHNQGLKLYNIPSNITKIIWTAKGGFKDNENDPSFSLLEERDLDIGQIEIITTPENNTSIVYVLPNDIYNGSATNNRIEAKLYNEDNLIATVYAPINMTLNTFGLASLNAWDGNTVTIDDEGGYIMSPQIGAGEKDDNNRFTGILMGKTETYTGGGDLEEQTGLFGYANGLQSIFLDSETGNATFGLPDVYSELDENGNVIKKYQHTNRQSGDDYGEGRIELRPGSESKIGGWRLGRRSLYYTSSPSSTEILVNPLTQYPYINRYLYSYSGEIGPAYEGDVGTPGNKQYATHHEKDIKTEDAGLLLSANPAYISIKGKKLGQTDIDNGLNSQLAIGDSLEIQLDPQTPTLFTIFRHNSNTRRENPGKRVYLAGINDKGELLANGVGKEDGSGTGTKSGNIVLKAFKDTIDQESGSYVGSVFEAGSGLASTRTFFQIFRERANPLDTSAQVYMTGGQITSSGEFVENNTGDEYLRPISIHGNSISLFARTGNPNEVIGYDENGDPIVAGYNWTSTDANIQITTDQTKIELGDSTGLLLQRNYNASNGNYLHTAGPMTINIGDANTAAGKRALNVNAAATSIAINGAIINNAGNTSINNTGTTTVNSQSNISLNRINIINNTSTIISELQLQQNNVLLGIPAGDDRKSLITMSHNGINSWDTIGSIKLNTDQASSQIILNVDQDVTGSGSKSGNAGSLNSINTQILLQTGTHTRLGLTSSSTHWAGTRTTPGTGYPFYLDMGSIGTMAVVTHHLADTTGVDSTKMVNTLQLQNLNLQISRGISITGNLSEYNSTNKTIETSQWYSLIADNGIQIKQDASYYAFKSTNFTGANKSPSYHADNGGYYSVNSIQYLHDAINNCLKAAGLAKAAADSASDSVTSLRDELGSAAWKNIGDFRSSSWMPSASDVGAVSTSTYNSHTHSSGSGSYFVNASGVPHADSITGVIENTMISSRTGTPS